MELSLYNSDKTFVIDDEDYDKLIIHNTKFHLRGNGTVAVWSKIANKEYSVSRIVMDSPDDNGLDVDHKDTNKLNNSRKNNLRFATFSQNQANRSKPKGKYSSIYKGVTFNKREKRWKASLTKDGEFKHLGCFNSEIEAAKAYNKAAIEFFGEYAYLNKI